MKKLNIGLLFIIFILIISLFSCYNLKVGSGGTCSSEYNNEDGFWRDVMVQDTTVRLKITQNIMQNICPDNCICQIEYKVNFGRALLATITFGAVRKMKVRYACCQKGATGIEY